MVLPPGTPSVATASPCHYGAGVFDDRYVELLRPVFAGRRWIIAIDDLSATTPLVEALRSLGAGPVLVVAGRRGYGPIPDGSVETCIVDQPLRSQHGMLQSWDAALVDLPRRVRRKIDEFDPYGEAQVITALLTTLRTIAGREVFGARDPTWLRLQDRAVVDRIWRVAGVRDVRRVVVPADPPALRAAAREIDMGSGTVWVSDRHDGWHGRDGYLRWVRTRVDADEAAVLFHGRAKRVRVMPFLDGIPCSIDGLVFPDDVVVLRPTEMVVLRRPRDSRLCYASSATLWDPPEEAREDMRTTARSVGRYLQGALDYRGAFTIDGVMTVDGFVPIELNPRYGSMLGAIARASGAPLYLLTLSLMSGAQLDIDTTILESELLEAADERRVAQASLRVASPRRYVEDVALRWTDAGFVVVTEDEADALLTLGPGPRRGAMVRVVLDTTLHPPGPSIAPKVVSAFAVADDLWNLGIGELEPAPDLCGEGRHAVA